MNCVWTAINFYWTKQYSNFVEALYQLTSCSLIPLILERSRSDQLMDVYLLDLENLIDYSLIQDPGYELFK